MTEGWSVPVFQAHKALLATQSDYFRVMFTADMRERDQDKIHMKGLTAAGFGHILRFMYYGSLELSMPTVQEILQVSKVKPLKVHVLLQLKHNSPSSSPYYSSTPLSLPLRLLLPRLPCMSS